MSLCKERIHDEVCSTLYELNGIPKVGGSTHCGYFRNKELNVQFPCKPGDTVFVKRNFKGEVIEGRVESVHRNAIGKEAMRWIVSIWFDEFYGKISDLGDLSNKVDSDYLAGHFYIPVEEFDKPISKRCYPITFNKEELIND